MPVGILKVAQRGSRYYANFAYAKVYKFVATSMEKDYGNNWTISRIKFYDKYNAEILPQNITEIDKGEVDFTLNNVKIKLKGSYTTPNAAYTLKNVLADGNMVVWFAKEIPDDEIGKDGTTLFITQEADAGFKYIEFDLTWGNYVNRVCKTFDFYKGDTKILENQTNTGDLIKIEV